MAARVRRRAHPRRGLPRRPREGRRAHRREPAVLRPADRDVPALPGRTRALGRGVEGRRPVLRGRAAAHRRRTRRADPGDARPGAALRRTRPGGGGRRAGRGPRERRGPHLRVPVPWLSPAAPRPPRPAPPRSPTRPRPPPPPCRPTGTPTCGAG
ncbi:hypothetical protein SGPA1_31296 [Streptomyces misionensis JCM 4497]